ncbi:MAG: hypothetical protein NZZ41_00020 [Candidatus Dojkabacteria bacterium]|nr:hypothetical protein [Candidatus Dojkabacteria bacterium]
MKNKSKTKGKNGERELVRILDEIFGEKFGRVFGSGLLTGGKNQEKIEKLNEIQILSSTGDIIPPEKFKNFVFECKWYKDFQWFKLFKEKHFSLLENENGWISQISKISNEKKWFLCMKFNHQGWFVLVDKENVNFDENFLTDLTYLRWYSSKYDRFFYIFELKKFFEKYKELL